jgi:hypothetical protein
LTTRLRVSLVMPKRARGMMGSSAVYLRFLQEQSPEQVSQAEEDQDHDRHDSRDQPHHVEKL